MEIKIKIKNKFYFLLKDKIKKKIIKKKTIKRVSIKIEIKNKK
jgi:hypothetical protein